MRGDNRKISTTQFNNESKLDYKSSAQPDWNPKVVFGFKKGEERKRVEWRGKEKRGVEENSKIKFHCLV